MDASKYRLRPRSSPWKTALSSRSKALCWGATLLAATAAVASAQDVPASSSLATIPASSSSSSSSASAALPTTSPALVDGTAAPYQLQDLIAARSTINIASPNSGGAFFHLAPPTSAAANKTAYITLSACSGPEIYPPAGSSAQTDFDKTYLRLVVSTDSANQQPDPGSSDVSVLVARGGFASNIVPAGSASNGLWLGVYPPSNAYGTTGNLTFDITASYNVPPFGYSYAGSYDPMAQDKPVYGLELDDTDTNAALLSALPQAKYPYSIPQVGIALSTTNQAPSPYFNSSACAIRDAYTQFYNSLPQAGRDIVQRNITARGMRLANDTQRTEFRIDGLQPGTNYTAWLTTDPSYPPQGSSFFYGPAIKFKTKTNENCRLLSNVDFCPDLAYATPIGPGVSTDDAVANVNATIFPVFQNFTRTLRTFACDSTEFGMYSYIATCDDCDAAYKRWACSVAFPRCVDPVTNTSQSAASQDGLDLTGAVIGVNSQLYPYVINRQDSTRLNTSVGVQGSYGELLPCLDVCNFVSIMCPPLISWTCPVWDITAQRDYGTFADANAYGFGPYGTGDDDNGPRDGKVFGGVQRYVATDGFGNAYCNALGVDRFLRQNNRAAASFQGAARWSVLAAFASISVAFLSAFVA